MEPGVATIDEVTSALLSEILSAPVRQVHASPFAHGNVSASYRLALTYEGDATGPQTLVAKIPSADPALKSANVPQARGEVGFYRHIAPTVDVAVPHCFHAAVSDDGERMLLLLEEIAPLHPVDQLSGCSPQQAVAAAVNVAALHRSTWDRSDVRELPFLAPLGSSMADLLQAVITQRVPDFAKRFSLDTTDAAILHAYAEALAPWFHGRTDHFSLLHNDFRIDNLLFAPELSGPRPVVAVDWGTISTGLPGRDLAYLVSTSLEPDDRREHERDIVASYNEALNSAGQRQTLEETWDDYVYGLFQAVLICVAASTHSAPSDRAERMFSVMIRRTLAAIRDHDAVSMLRQVG
jgi:aminoglycoside phosphotransferase (APT) family kinase protein